MGPASGVITRLSGIGVATPAPKRLLDCRAREPGRTVGASRATEAIFATPPPMKPLTGGGIPMFRTCFLVALLGWFLACGSSSPAGPPGPPAANLDGDWHYSEGLR